MKTLDLKIEDLTSPDFKFILDRAEDRIEEALLHALVSRQSRDEIEIPSFPIAMMMVAATDDARIQRRYGLAEAKRIYNLLKNESKEKMIGIANNFNWMIERLEGAGTYDFALHFTDFLKNTTVFREKKWKLVNRAVLKGQVYMTRDETARLLEEEVRRHIEEKLDTRVGMLPKGIASRVERLKQIFAKQKGKIRLEELPKEVNNAAFPPCIKSLYDAIASGRRVSHIGRFTLTSFLINIGMTPSEVVDLFRSLTDFSERMTRYQVEHIAGERGSRTKYLSPRCDTLRTHGVCPGMEEICRSIRHPLAYYRRKLRATKTETSVGQAEEK